MRIKRGWSGDYGKDRLDVETDEGDLVRLLVEKSVEDPQGVIARMTNRQASRLLDLEALFYGTLSRALDIEDDADPKRRELARKAAGYQAKRDAQLSKVLDPEPET